MSSPIPGTRRRGARPVIVAAVLALSALLAACSGADPKPQISIAAGEAKTTVEPTLYCVGGHAELAGDKASTAALEVKPDTKVTVEVPKEVADAGWTIQIWSVSDSGEGPVPYQQIGNVPVGTKRSFDGFTTSDAVPSRYFVIVALPEDAKCDAKGSAGIWTVLVSRVS
ncbi:DUF2771 family protein [Cumulibacter manganitolerans]|uniref:DUF2771 family protein n=1 Tax=Cumulibacter manganitolerans TaxID=1884992 RepID=UPI001885AEEF|nr:DUF2771 family protein [Cumulibacter manganitolerans]